LAQLSGLGELRLISQKLDDLRDQARNQEVISLLGKVVEIDSLSQAQFVAAVTINGGSQSIITSDGIEVPVNNITHVWNYE